MARSKKSQQSPAFPQAAVVESVAHSEGPTGLTDRQLYAAFSLCGIRASGEPAEAEFAAKAAVADADALLAELAKVQP